VTTSESTRVEQLRVVALAAIEACRRLDYSPTYWERTVKELGALDAHKRVLRPGRPHDGFVRLAFLMNPPHPELTAEYVALYSFPDLFTEEELAVARGRLE
jgi:hypothetical protein